METSAKTGLNAQEIFVQAVEVLCEDFTEKEKKLKGKEDEKTENKNVGEPKEKIKQKKIQIVAFSADDTDYTPIYIINIFLG